MAAAIAMDPDGAFEVDGRTYRVPRDFTSREIYSYRRLLEPIPDIPGGTSLSDRQRAEQRAFLLRRAAACVIPGLQAEDLEGLPLSHLRGLHRWIAEHRSELAVVSPLLS